MKNNWTADEIYFLRQNYETMGPKEISTHLGLPRHTIKHKASLLNLKYNKKTINNLKEEFINKAKEIHGDKYDYSLVEYVNCRTKVKIYCPKHGIFEQYPTSHITHKQNCPICAKTSINTEILIKRFKDEHGDKYDYSKVTYTGKDCFVNIICKTHGEFIQRYDSHANGYGCHKCLNSLGEKVIEKYLTENKIKFIPQHKYPECKFKKELPFDFYLPDYNICVEYNGMQHYEPVKYWGGEKGFKQQIIRDKIKMEYCNDNNIPLLIIKYDENIIDSLYNYLSSVVYSKPSFVLKNTIC
jgi:hypothetical protein